MAQSETPRPTVHTESSLHGEQHKAEAWARMVERDMDSGAFVVPDESDRTTLDEALVRQWQDIASKNRHPSQERQRIKH